MLEPCRHRERRWSGRIVRWLALAVAGLQLLVVSALYVGAELRLRQRYDQPLYPL